MSQQEFWDRVATVNAGMLDVSNGDRLVPMSHHADRDQNALWFISAKGTDAVMAAETGPTDCTYVLADNDKGLYAQVNGVLTVSGDQAKLDELWSPVAGAWFEGGKDDPDLRLLCLRISDAEVWATPTSGIVFMYHVARAQLTGKQPDMGSHFKI